MSRIEAAVFEGLGGAVIGAAGLLAAGSFLPGGASPGDLGLGAVLLVRETTACPAGWTAGGQVRLLASPDYALSPDQTASNPGVMTTSTMDWSNVNFYLCTRGAE